MDKLCRLELVGITYNQIENGVYAMVLQEEGEKHRRLVIIIGTSEAQSIECKLQNIIPPRPLAHDFIESLLSTYKIKLKKVEIYRLENGVFAATLHLSQQLGEETLDMVLDARSSDAIAIAIRTNSPIYCSDNLLEEVCYYNDSALNKKKQKSKTSDDELLCTMKTSELESLLKKAVDDEQYELASKIKAELDRRNSI